MANRMSTFSTTSRTMGAPAAHQLSTTTLLNALHTIYTQNQCYALDASSSLAVNTWLNASEATGAQLNIDAELSKRAWEHARRRAEDGCIVLGSLHKSSPSLLVPFLYTFPFEIPHSLITSLSVIRAFTHAVSPQNASTPLYSALRVALTINTTGELSSASVSLSTAGTSVSRGLLNLPQESGYRAFDAFYYILTSVSSAAEREVLGLKRPQEYALLSKTGTYGPPSYLPTADDAAAAEDFRESLKAIGIRGTVHRSLISTLAAILKLGDALGFLVEAEELDDICEEVANLLDLDPEVLARKCSTEDRDILVASLYEALLDWVIQKANQAIRAEIRGHGEDDMTSEGGWRTGAHSPQGSDEFDDTVTINVVEVPDPEVGKAVSMRTVFDDSQGINAEMKEDGADVQAAGGSVLKEMEAAVQQAAYKIGPSNGSTRDWDHELDRRQGVLEKVGAEAEANSFLHQIIYPVAGDGSQLGRHGRFDLGAVMGGCRVWFHLSLHPTDDTPAKLASLTTHWSAGTVSRQLRAWRLPEWSNRRHRNLDFTADFDLDEFANRYSPLGCQDGRDGVENWVIERGWSNGDVVIGHERVWIREGAWWEAESMLDLKMGGNANMATDTGFGMPPESGYSATPMNGSGFFPPMGAPVENPFDSNVNLARSQSALDEPSEKRPKSVANTISKTLNTMPGDYGLGAKGDDRRDWDHTYDDEELGDGVKDIKTEKRSFSRRAWVAFVWTLTFWIPSPLLKYVGRMKRPDVRMAWREKLVLVLMILLLNATVVFFIVAFGRLLCPNADKAFTQSDVGTHQGTNDFYVSIHGVVYDITNFYQIPHGDPKDLTTSSEMLSFAGADMDEYFPIPLNVGCSSLVTDKTLSLRPNASNPITNSAAEHVSGYLQPNPTLGLHDQNWYYDTFLPKIQGYYKGDVVWSKSNISSQGKDNARPWFILNNKVYDLTDYFYNVNTVYKGDTRYQFMPEDVIALIQGNMGQDLSDKWGHSTNYTNALQCLNSQFYIGIPDFRDDARCLVVDDILLAFTVIVATVILVKFVAALRFGSKRMPAPQDKFVICQIPAYTEGEEHLRKGLDSLTALNYDNKRKLLCVICDGMVVGGGNDRPTPKIVLDILGVDPKIDPPALPFKSVGTGATQLNYGKVYSGLYEFEGNVVPYIVIVKVGKESEQAQGKPGNRGKRDSQILLMSFLNRVHHRSPMNPLELEIFHQINNIIGVDPELYEYLLMVDADTTVREDSLTRLVAACANDSRIAGICGETNLENEGRSWWTMIQVYEYYISHHLSKAFESLFGSVTCLPGCFSMYRIRTVDKGKPLIIADKVIEDYSEGNVDTLHKKNLLSLGEDRYLTTLMTKNFPSMSYKFIPDAYAATAAPETWGVLLSQRRRWINSTIHNLVELLWVDLCGFCCFSMRFVVFIDLTGTLILPATCAYIVYLIYNAASSPTHSFPIISVILLAAVYGLQMIIFLLRRQWQHIGWMIIYILAFPLYSVVLPLYSFWKQDDFSWGSTRVVVGEKGAAKVVAVGIHDKFDPRSIPLERWDDYAARNTLPGRRGEYVVEPTEKGFTDSPYSDNAYEMDEIRSTYSSMHPATTVLTGMQGHQGSQFMPPQSPAAFHGQDMYRSQSRMSGYTRFTDAPQYGQRAQSRQMSTHDLIGQNRSQSPYQDAPQYGQRHSRALSSHDNLMAMASPADGMARAKSPLSRSHSRLSMMDPAGGAATPQIRDVDDVEITQVIRACLGEVDLDNVTKKQVRSMVEQRLGTVLTGDKRAFMDKQIDAELENMDV